PPYTTLFRSGHSAPAGPFGELADVALIGRPRVRARPREGGAEPAHIPVGHAPPFCLITNVAGEDSALREQRRLPLKALLPREVVHVDPRPPVDRRRPVPEQGALVAG